MRYALNRWPAFTLFLEDGRVAIDNNRRRTRHPADRHRQQELPLRRLRRRRRDPRRRHDHHRDRQSSPGLNPEVYLADVLAGIRPRSSPASTNCSPGIRKNLRQAVHRAPRHRGHERKQPLTFPRRGDRENVPADLDVHLVMSTATPPTRPRSSAPGSAKLPRWHVHLTPSTAHPGSIRSSASSLLITERRGSAGMLLQHHGPARRHHGIHQPPRCRAQGPSGGLNQPNNILASIERFCRYNTQAQS